MDFNFYLWCVIWYIFKFWLEVVEEVYEMIEYIKLDEIKMLQNRDRLKSEILDLVNRKILTVVKK